MRPIGSACRAIAVGGALLVSGALADQAAAADPEFTLRVQTYLSAESIAGREAQAFFDDVEVMSGGRIKFEPFFSAAVVKSVETFDAAMNGILDVDMSTSTYQVGKDTAFQFIGDPMGGYDNTWQLYAFFYEDKGMELAQKLHDEYGMHFVGWWIQGPESLASTRPLAGPDDVQNWKFRSPPGMLTLIFSNLGAQPIVMDFTEAFTALESGIIDGTDAATISTNQSLGIYDIAKHTNYPGFHSLPAEHFTVRQDVWDSLPEDLQRIIEVGIQKLAFRVTLAYEVDNKRAAGEIEAQGVTLYDWSPEDRRAFREAALKGWEEFADTDAAKELVAAHKAFQRKINLIGDETAPKAD